MVQFEELRLRLMESEKPLGELASALGLEEMAKEVAVLEEQSAAEDFWNDLANSQKVLQRVASLKGKIKAYEDLQTAYEESASTKTYRKNANPAHSARSALTGHRLQ